MATQFTENNFQEQVLNESMLVVVDFYADWCGPCKIMGPIIEDLAKEYEGTVKIGKLNVDNCPNISGTYRVMSIPTIHFFKNGKVVDTVMGAVSKSVLQDKINQHK
ncbi:thioredoxin [Anaeromicropila populeti]|uniref:Thioredoxin n=1 Tax=Anaeromicropila populeti TaxID=37658 RepID=A0A1I6LB85_9FIRM|nr:thioredoxin [Anaeromicropila populeti]SFS00725.1 thioredoxin [Anaeromicropila populeti]